MKGITIGVTGTRLGMNKIQEELFTSLIHELEWEIFRHGDCEGFDKESHYIVRGKPNSRIIIHPPLNSCYRAYCSGENVEILEKKKYLERNHNIVDASNIIIAVPNTNNEIRRSGSWATIRYAKEKKKKMFIIFPNGKIMEE